MNNNGAKKRVVNQPKRTNIDMNVVKKMFEMYCTGEEIAAAFGVHCNTLKNRIREEEGCSLEELATKHRLVGNVSLRRVGRMMAEEDKTIWIFFAKNHLGMSDKQEMNISGINTTNISGSVILNMTDKQKLEMFEHMKKIGVIDSDGNAINNNNDSSEDTNE